MRKHLPAAGLIVCAFLLGIAIVIVASPHETLRPSAPTRTDSSPISTLTASGPLTADFGLLGAADTGPLPTPPAPPATESSVETGRLWVRVLDAATNRPLPNTTCRCEMVWPERSPWSEEPLPASIFLDRSTDPNGLLSFEFGDRSADDSQDFDIYTDPESGLERNWVTPSVRVCRRAL